MKKIALLGLGVVGKGTADLLTENSRMIAKRIGEDVEIKYILDLREFPGTPYEHKIVHDFSIIEKDPEIVLVAEMMGGAHPAYDFSKACLLAKKSVVTSNKQVVATFGEELTELARQNGVSYAFEASVGGGIPIVRPLCTDFLSNEVVGISGILNGTTNYILTEMKTKGKSYAAALSEAQAKGYAEKDPTADVEGIDTCRKICILTALATGILPDADKVRTVGISAIDGEDVALLDRYGYAVKLLGKMQMQNGKPCVLVAPFVCGADSPLAHVDDVFNGIMVEGATVGETMFYGRGAGAAPTASAVATDILSILKDGDASFAPIFHNAKEGELPDSGAFTCRRYFRSDKPITQIEAAVGKVKVLDGAFITEKAFAEAEWDALWQNSSLRVF